jgi:RHS repeat-associated protein
LAIHSNTITNKTSPHATRSPWLVGFRDSRQNEQIPNAMTAYQPKTLPSCVYDCAYLSYRGNGASMFGYDASINWVTAIHFAVSPENTAKSCQSTGKERDSESGLDYFGARYFGSALGRFTSPDPLMASAHASDPQSWNRYAYAMNNPLRFVDPDGMEVPAACADNKNCQIVVKINVIYDQTVNNGKGNRWVILGSTLKHQFSSCARSRDDLAQNQPPGFPVPLNRPSQNSRHSRSTFFFSHRINRLAAIF